MTPGSVAVRAVVSGRVQGVGFRWACRRVAQERGVTGWAVNLPSGEVEVHAEGAPDDVAALVAWTRAGPPGAEVTGVDVREEAVRGLAGFTIA